MNFIKFYIFICIVIVTFAFPNNILSDECDNKCKLPNCKCPSTSSPRGFNITDIPQIVLLTFDDAVQVTNYEFYKKFFEKKNPDGCPIGITYFISHEYTDYSLVHDLYEHGHEIALHSISHETLTDYWKYASVDLLKKEFGGEIEIISKFANIPKEHIYGGRIPFLQLSGDNGTKAFKEIGLQYDCSWPTRTYTDPGLWPYTLDYFGMQDCPIGPCPTNSVPGLWIQPMIDMTDNSGIFCAMADACVDVPKDVEGLFNFMVRNFEVQYKGNRAPFGFYVHAGWFLVDSTRFDAYMKFIDYLLDLKDVFIVNVHRAIEWMKNPNPINKIKETWTECVKPTLGNCTKHNCELFKGNETRFMKICPSSCPAKYPWVDNPLGL